MGRKKRGGKSTLAARQAKAAKNQKNIEENVSLQCFTESEESCSSETPKSCNTPVNVDKSTVSSATLIQHKKFGKIRCLISNDANKAEASSSEGEIQMESLEIDTKELEIITINPEDMKNVEISDVVEIPICSDDILHEEIAVEITEMEVDSNCQIENDFPIIIETSDKNDDDNSQELQLEDDSINKISVQYEENIENLQEMKISEEKLQEEPSTFIEYTESINEVKEIIINAPEETEIKEEKIEDLTPNIDVQLKNEINLKKEIEENEIPLIFSKENPPENKSLNEEIKTEKTENSEETKPPKPGSSSSSSSKKDSETTTVRRSSRIKSISVLKQRSRGHGLVKSDRMEKKERSHKSSKHSTDFDNLSENSNSNSGSSERTSNHHESVSFATPTVILDGDLKPVKVKSRWRRSSELEMGSSSPLVISSSSQLSPTVSSEEIQNSFVQPKNDSPVYDEEMENRLRQFQTLMENQYLTERSSCKEAKKMVCDCFLTKEEIERGEFGCGEDCLNRLLMIECGNQCVVGDRCTNKRFQKMQYALCEVFRTEKKGFGIRATADIPYGEFILEYVGEVLNPKEFDKRAKVYSKDKNRHYYFMALRADAVIDATQKGNISRFINHSCDPNAETQKWTVNGELRIGFFSKRTILTNEEITFDYQFQRYGKEAQRCYCEASNCRGWIGEEPDDEDDDDDGESEEEDREEEIEEDDQKETENDVKEAKPVIKPPVRKRRLNKKQRKDIFEDLDLDEEIEMLSTTGLKNQAHTLKLSRLMVRAKDVAPRMQLLKLLREGELPCRRLFLDYHGLRLIHGWMCDAADMTNEENDNYSFRIEILQTLATLPISNKTILQDSKVLTTVEKWSIKKEEDANSPEDSASNSPQIDAVSSTNLEIEKKEILKEEEEEEKMEIVEQSEVSEQIEIDSTKIEEVTVLEATVAEEKMEETISKSEELEVIELQDKLKEEEKENTILQEEKDKTLQDEKVSQEEKEDKSSENENENKIPEEEKEDKVPQEEKENKVPQEEKETKVIQEEKDTKVSQEEKEIKVPQEEKETKIPQEEKENKVPQEEKEVKSLQEEKTDLEKEKLISELTAKLLSDWSMLKEIFRIPKKERIEQMKEHEREADRDYKAGLGLESEVTSKRHSRYSWKNERYRIENERRKKELVDHDRGISNKKGIRIEDRNVLPVPRLSKYERRQLFALQVAQEEEGRRRKQKEEMMRLKEQQQRCMIMGNDPRVMGNDPGFQPYWNPVTGQWAPYPTPPGILPNQPPMFDMSCPRPPLPSVPPNVPHMIMPPLPGTPMGNRPPLLPTPLHAPPITTKEEVLFAGPIPPPVKLPSKWKCAKDKYGRPYYYHIKVRISQWEPPEISAPTEEVSNELMEETSSSSESSSLSSDSTTDSDDDSELGDTKLLLEIRNKLKLKHLEPKLPIPLDLETTSDQLKEETIQSEDTPKQKRIETTNKRKRDGLVQEIIISPRTEEDKITSKLDLKKIKERKEKLRRQKQLLVEQTKKKSRSKSSKTVKKYRLSKSAKLKSVSNIDMNSEEARKIKEIFRSSVASVMVQNLNGYRKPDCKNGRITNTDDFKHLARKLTHFVMLKELKHCKNIEDLTCNESVKAKAKEFIKKYMSKFGEIYNRPKDDTFE